MAGGMGIVGHSINVTLKRSSLRLLRARRLMEDHGTVHRAQIETRRFGVSLTKEGITCYRWINRIGYYFVTLKLNKAATYGLLKLPSGGPRSAGVLLVKMGSLRCGAAAGEWLLADFEVEELLRLLSRG
ncbi:hypothetical protein Nepgr_027194 [Nepenthes gracilis]|uniref:Uncharacterized protein n=1 Tax=Nepenthes gracilis TaxID=150966 RepID=A0AAD3Y3B1_NEPGR|nr:hypothetical protein Nepgr_027194 [Nepenthes gracilis]